MPSPLLTPGMKSLVVSAQDAQARRVEFIPDAPVAHLEDDAGGTRIKVAVDFPARLAIGATLGRGTTIPACSGLAARTQSVSWEETRISTRTQETRRWDTPIHAACAWT